MPTIQQIYAMARRLTTAMAEAFARACMARAERDGIELQRAPRPRPPVPPFPSVRRARDPYDLTEREWERMVRGNSDTRWVHC